MTSLNFSYICFNFIDRISLRVKVWRLTPQRKCQQILTLRGGRMLQPSERTKLHQHLIKPSSFWRWTAKCFDSIASGMTGITCLEKHAPMSFM